MLLILSLFLIVLVLMCDDDGGGAIFHSVVNGLSLSNSWHAQWIHHHPHSQSIDTNDISSSSLLTQPPRRSGQMSFIIPQKQPQYHPTTSDDKFSTTNDLYVFGGYVEEDIKLSSTTTPTELITTTEHVGGNVRRFATNDLWRYRINTKNNNHESDDSTSSSTTKSTTNDDGIWESISTNGNIPTERLVGTIVSFANDDDITTAYLIGGWNSNTNNPDEMFLDTIHRLDIIPDSNNATKWTLLPVRIPDGPCSRHISIPLSKNRILIHNHRCIDYVYIFDCITNQFHKQVTTGNFPGSIGLHCCTTINHNQLFIFGGAYQNGTMSNHIHVLDLNEWKWTSTTSTNTNIQQPTPRAGSSMCYVDDESVIIYGGAERSDDGSGSLKARGDVWLYHIPTHQWTLLMNDDTIQNIPSPRNAASLLPIIVSTTKQKQTEQYYKLYGGWLPFQETYNDNYWLHLYKKK